MKPDDLLARRFVRFLAKTPEPQKTLPNPVRLARRSFRLLAKVVSAQTKSNSAVPQERPPPIENMTTR
jgi:hypothetical protein